MAFLLAFLFLFFWNYLVYTFLTAFLKDLLYLMNNWNSCCEIVKSKNELDRCVCFRTFNTVLLKSKLQKLFLQNE